MSGHFMTNMRQFDYYNKNHSRAAGCWASPLNSAGCPDPEEAPLLEAARRLGALGRCQPCTRPVRCTRGGVHRAGLGDPNSINVPAQAPNLVARGQSGVMGKIRASKAMFFAPHAAASGAPSGGQQQGYGSHADRRWAGLHGCHRPLLAGALPRPRASARRRGPAGGRPAGTALPGARGRR
ncbi:unnamed protein product, partial [Prorocentrum cordatum]